MKRCPQCGEEKTHIDFHRFLKDDPTLLLRAADYLLGIAKPDIFAATYDPA